MGVFTGCQIAFDLTSNISFKKKKELRNAVTDNGGIVSFIVTKQVRNLIRGFDLTQLFVTCDIARFLLLSVHNYSVEWAENYVYTGFFNFRAHT